MAINTLATETLFQRTLDKLAVQEAVTGWMDANTLYNADSTVEKLTKDLHLVAQWKPNEVTPGTGGVNLGNGWGYYGIRNPHNDTGQRT